MICLLGNITFRVGFAMLCLFIETGWQGQESRCSKCLKGLSGFTRSTTSSLACQWRQQFVTCWNRWAASSGNPPTMAAWMTFWKQTTWRLSSLNLLGLWSESLELVQCWKCRCRTIRQSNEVFEDMRERFSAPLLPQFALRWWWTERRETYALRPCGRC